MPHIIQELHRANELLKDVQGKTVTIFGSSRITEGDKYYDLAFKLARVLAIKGYNICTGGGPGIMEAGNKGAQVPRDCSAGCRATPYGKSIGLNINLSKENDNLYQDISVPFDNFFTRKAVFADISDAYIVMPGGYGTLDELFEILTIIQCKKHVPSPVILMDSKHYGGLVDYVYTNLLQTGYIKHEDYLLMTLADTMEDALEFLKEHL